MREDEPVQQAQAQDSLTAQLARLHVLAIANGLYDAADWITNSIAAQNRTFGERFDELMSMPINNVTIPRGCFDDD